MMAYIETFIDWLFAPTNFFLFVDAETGISTTSNCGVIFIGLVFIWMISVICSKKVRNMFF